MTFLLHWLGLDNGSGPQYLFWSGFFADLTIFGVFVGAYRKINCNVRGCWRLQWRDYVDADGVRHKWCKKHHPTAPVHRKDHAAFLELHERRKAHDGINLSAYDDQPPSKEC